MIFVTLGTSDYPFTRLLKQIDDLIENNNIKNIIVQCGNEDYQPKNFTIIKNLDKKEFNEYLKKAEVVITHGGVGTIIDCIKTGKKVIAFPRKAEYGEAKNNHQEQIINNLKNKGSILTGEINDLAKLLEKIKTLKKIKLKSNNDNFNYQLCKIIDAL